MLRICLCLAAAAVSFSGCGPSPSSAPQASSKKPSKKVSRAETPPPKSPPKPSPKPAVTVAQDAFPNVQQAIATLATALKASGDSENDQSEKDDAKKALAWLTMNKATAVPQLAELLNRPDEKLETQIATCWALGRMGSAATPALLANIDHPTRQVRMKVMESLSYIKPADAKVVSKLIELLKSDDQPTRQAAVQGLARIGPPAKAAANGLIAILNNTSESEALRSDAKAALKKVDQRRGLMGVAEMPVADEIGKK